MENSSVVINTVISFIIHSLEDLKNSGYEILSPVIIEIEKIHRNFRESGNKDYLYKMVSYFSDYKGYGHDLGEIFIKLREILSSIVNFLKEKSLFVYEMIVLKLIEFYHYILKVNVKTYLKFEELEEIIRYIREDIIRDNKRENMKEELKKRTYDDVILKMLLSLLNPPDKKYNSFIEFIDMVLIPDQSSSDNISQTLNKIQNKDKMEENKKENLSSIELLKLKKKEKEIKQTNNNEDKPQSETENIINDNSVKIHTVMDDLLKDLMNQTDELIDELKENNNEFNIDHNNFMKLNYEDQEISGNSCEEYFSKYHYTKKQESPECKTPITNHSDEKIIFTENIKTNYNDKIELIMKDSSPLIIKEKYENKDDKIKRILAKYSKCGKNDLDKSPPIGTNNDSMNKILNDRKFY